jgi:Glutaminase
MEGLRGSCERLFVKLRCCGMYDFAGEWICHVRIPVKSGVGGGILAVLPGRAVFQRADVAAEADIEALIARAVSEFGRLDVNLQQRRSYTQDSYGSEHFEKYSLFPKRGFEKYSGHPGDSTGYSNL